MYRSTFFGGEFINNLLFHVGFLHTVVNVGCGCSHVVDVTVLADIMKAMLSSFRAANSAEGRAEFETECQDVLYILALPSAEQVFIYYIYFSQPQMLSE